MAYATESLEKALESIDQIAKALGLKGSRRDEVHLMIHNIENLMRRTACLSAIETTFFLDSRGDCKLNWGHGPEDYVARFAEINEQEGEAVSKAIVDVIDERRRQVEIGYTAEHDDEHADGMIADEASNYLMTSQYPHRSAWCYMDKHPHSEEAVDRRTQVVIGTALAIAEIERIDRLEAKARLEAKSHG